MSQIQAFHQQELTLTTNNTKTCRELNMFKNIKLIMLIFDNLENQPVEVLVLGHNNHPKIDKVEVQIKLANTKKI